MRYTMPDDMEKVFQCCNSVKDVRSLAQRCPPASVQPCKDLLSSFVEQLQLHDERRSPSDPATEDEISDLWEEMQ